MARSADAWPALSEVEGANPNHRSKSSSCGKVVRMDPNLPGSREDEVGELRARIRRLELALYRQGILAEDWPGSAPATTSPPAPPSAVAPVPPPAQIPPPQPRQPIAVPSFGMAPASPQQPEASLESRIGSQWFNRIGILAVLIGVAWFLKFAFDNHWIGPLGRILIGLVAGAGLIAWSERFRSRGFTAFSYSLKSVGSGILYLSLWAAFSLYHLIPAPVAFGAMIAVTAFNGF